MLRFDAFSLTNMIVNWRSWGFGLSNKIKQRLYSDGIIFLTLSGFYLVLLA